MEVIQKYQCILGNSAAQKVIFLTAPRFLTFFLCVGSYEGSEREVLYKMGFKKDVMFCLGTLIFANLQGK